MYQQRVEPRDQPTFAYPRPSKLFSPLEDCVVDIGLHLRESMLELMGHEEAGEAGTNGDDAKFAWRECELVVQTRRLWHARSFMSDSICWCAAIVEESIRKRFGDCRSHRWVLALIQCWVT